MQHVIGNYRRAPVAFSHGQGARLWDTQGREYLDFVGGVAVSSLGHAHPALVQAICEQARRYLHVSNLYLIPEQEEAARRLAQASGLDKVFFCNSGTEANEAAIKLARRYGQAQGKSRILAAENSFHGRTLGALAATGNPAYHEGFGPLPEGFGFLPFGDLRAWERALDETVCAVLVEPIQGEGGVLTASSEFWRGLQQLCRSRGALLILDEVQTGVGRTGSMFAFQRLGLTPDLVTVAKGLGGGVPIGALLTRGPLAEVLGPGSHGCTFGGNALSCAAACVVLDTVPLLLASVRTVGERLKQGLERIPGVLQVRGQGLLLGADLAVEAGPVSAACLEQGLMVNALRPRTLRLAPPLVVSASEVDRALKILETCLTSTACLVA